MGEWSRYKFEDLFLVPLKNGLNKPSRVRGEGIPMINMKEIFGFDVIDDSTPMEHVPVDEKEKAFLLLKNDLLFARQSLVESGAGKISIFKGSKETVFESHLIRCRIDELKGFPDFIYYLFKSPQGKGTVSTIVEQTAAAGIRGSDLKNLQFIFPPLLEQKAIASILSSLDDKIDLLHRQNKTLEQLAETLFRQWFVEEADEEWEKQSLGNLIELDRGISYRGDLLGEKGTGMPMHNLGSIDINGSYKFEGIKYYTGEVKEKQKLNAGDLLIINTDITQDNRIIGWPIFVPSIFIESTFTHHLYVAKLKTSSVSKFYLYFLLRYRDYRDALASNANGTTVSMLSKEAIYNIEIKIPPKNKREQFEMIANKILDKQTINQNQIRTLTQLRDSLLPKLMSGEVRVK